jgi:superfamily II DNA or RNA helicase
MKPELRVYLPPNFAAAAARNAIAVKVELELSSAPKSELLPAFALLMKMMDGATPSGMPARIFLQFSRLQLRELIAAASGMPVFFWVNAPDLAIAWTDSDLVGASEHLAGFPTAAPTPASVEPIRIQKRTSTSAAPLTVDGSEHYLALTLPSPEHPTYDKALDLVKSRGFVLEPSNRKWWLRDRHKVLNLLAEHGSRLRGELEAQFTSNFEKNTAHLRSMEIVCGVDAKGSGFEVTLALKAGAADEGQIRSAMAGSRSYLEDDGGIFLLDPAQLRRLGEAQQALAGDPSAGHDARRTLRVSAARAPELDAMLEGLSPGFLPPASWKERSRGLRDLTSLAKAPVPAELDALLRPYQRVGAAWLWHLYRQRLGGVLADEMGLGKTLQALTLLAAIQSGANGAARCSLVICPASLVENWRREASRFAPGLRVFVHHGGQRLVARDEFTAHELVITSYGTLARDQELFAGTEFACVVADEAQHIKNRRSQNARTLRSLRAGARFLLTGTPLENSLDDLRSLFEFILPGYIDPVPAGVRGDERRWYDDRLRAKTAPFILRRTKQAVAPELPSKLEQIVWCELLPEQAALYRQVQERGERELFDLAAGGANEGQVRIAALTQLLRLRQICCDPRLLPGSQNEPVPSGASGANYEPVPSAKLEAFLELLAEAVDDGHRVLVFSQFTSLLALVRAELESQETATCYLDGSMSVKARQAEVDRFQSSPAVPVFLLSLKAGGTGLNLTGADTVVHYDPWWNPAVEAQATDRAHRIGQARTVTSYKLIAAGTVEEKVLGLQEEKRALLADVFEASDAAAAKLSLRELTELLKR